MDKNLVNMTSEGLVQNAPHPLPNQEVFLGSQYPHKKLAIESFNIYKVYKSRTESVDIEAESAAKAMELSGITTPYKIVRAATEMNRIIQKGMLIDVTAAPAPSAMPESNLENPAP